MNGIVVHHTAGRNSLNLCYNGTSSLPGPLCHAHLAKDGTLSLISNGRANHAGSFAANAFNAMLNESDNHPRPDSAEPIDANARTYGIEIENLGNGRDPYPAVQYDAAVRWAAAICRAHGWSADSVIGHKEGTRRKIDPTFSMDKFRANVAARLSGQGGAAPDVSAPAPDSKPNPPKVSGHPARYQVTINGQRYGYGAYGPHVTAVGRALVSAGFGRHYKSGPGPKWTDADTKNYADYQRSLGYSGSDADGVPGATSLGKLLKRSGVRTVSVAKLVSAAKSNPPMSGTPVTYSGVRTVEAALSAAGFLASGRVDGHFGSDTVRAYAKWQRKLGYRGRDADGIPGHSSLSVLAARYGFKVSA
ncbi:peptidoglycan-binding protein [Streptomyces lycii]|uniref:peptidoglycan-binding protein n=1 Tax=Streptomyces lycii TaxID=2654337 RepID=UPI002E252315